MFFLINSYKPDGKSYIEFSLIEDVLCTICCIAFYTFIICFGLICCGLIKHELFSQKKRDTTIKIEKVLDIEQCSQKNKKNTR